MVAACQEPERASPVIACANGRESLRLHGAEAFYLRDERGPADLVKKCDPVIRLEQIARRVARLIGEYDLRVSRDGALNIESPGGHRLKATIRLWRPL